MLFPLSVLRSVLALYGFGTKSPRRRTMAPMLIGRPAPPRYS